MRPGKLAIGWLVLLILLLPVASLAQSGRVKPKRREKITTINSSWEKVGVPAPASGKVASAREEPAPSEPARPRGKPTVNEPPIAKLPPVIIGGGRG
jgi:hypothetical protein